MSKDIEIKTKNLVDELKKVCADHGLGNDGNEYKIITEVFLYKFMNDKFFYEVKKDIQNIGMIKSLKILLKP